MADGLSRLPRRLKVVYDDDDDDTNHKFPSSVHKVLSNDDLLMEILLRLPVVSLHLFKPVSKQWLSLITSPTFILTRTRIPTIDPPSGLFIARECWDRNEYDFVSFDPRIPSKRSILLTFNSKVHIMRSCNGLLLCDLRNDGKECVCNPLINMFEILPPIHYLNYEYNCDHYTYMAFDPTKSPFYKAVLVGEVEDDDEFDSCFRIQTYSSETGVWSVWDDRFSIDSDFESFRSGIYWNGAIHWLSYFKKYFHLKLDIMDRPVLTNIQIPHPVIVEGKVPHDLKLFKSHGSLLLLCKDYACSRHLHIFEMQTGSSEWSVRYSVNLLDILRPFPTLRIPARWKRCDILSIVLGERKEDSFIVIELSGQVLQYNFLLKTVSELFDLGKGFSQSGCFEFIASFAHV